MTTTKAYFENINEEIAKQLKAAKHTIHVAVAWLTDDYLLRILTEKAEKGLFVSIMVIDDEANRSLKLYHKDLLNAGVQFNLVNNNEDLMHNKFCVIDHSTIITGSYNWTINAQFNNENILVVKDNVELATSYLIEYYRMMKKFLSCSLPAIEAKKPVKWAVARELNLNLTQEEIDQIEM